VAIGQVGMDVSSRYRTTFRRWWLPKVMASERWWASEGDGLDAEHMVL